MTRPELISSHVFCLVASSPKHSTDVNKAKNKLQNQMCIAVWVLDHTLTAETPKVKYFLN